MRSFILCVLLFGLWPGCGPAPSNRPRSAAPTFAAGERAARQPERRSAARETVPRAVPREPAARLGPAPPPKRSARRGTAALPWRLLGTSIADTAQNRAVLAVVDRYRQAMLRLDPRQLLALAHPAYHDRAGTPSPADDIRYRDLARILRTRLAQVRAIRMTMSYRAVRWQGADQATVALRITAAFQLAGSGPPRWHRKSDFNQMTLRRHRGKWLILSGM